MGLLIIISSPTGGGKDAVIACLLKIFPNSARLVTTTSRPPRPTDKEGITYNFISPKDFADKIKQGYFLEYNNCVGNYYGTPKKYLENILKKYSLVFSNIDVNGKHSMDKLGVNNLAFFLLPESMEVLKQRAEKRGGMTNKMIQDRIKLGAEEIAKSKNYAYQITNYEGKLDITVATIALLIKNYLKKHPAY
ncbi:MAG: guanylate kinase [Patescibacteria group bacterium]